MPWFPNTRDSSDGWRFDIVGLLAVIGESSIADHVQTITASPFSYFPRLIPAPQTLLKKDRPKRLPSIPNVKVVGVYSGTEVKELNYFANAIHDIDSIKDFEFREYYISHKDEAIRQKDQHVADQRAAAAAAPPIDPSNAEKGNGDIRLLSQRAATIPNETAETKIHIPMYTNSVLNAITLISVLMTIGLFVWAALIHDGVACVAIITISSSTSLACLSSQWKPRIAERPSSGQVPDGDVVLSTRGAAFIVVHCSDEITRELYVAAERCEYVVSKKVWSVLVNASTILLMLSVVLLGNCEWTMQAAIGVALVILNAVYWALPFFSKEKKLWNMEQRYNIREELHLTKQKGEEVNVALAKDKWGNRPSYTRTLALAIQHTKATTWVMRSGLANKTPQWEKWLAQAKDNIGNPDWNAVEEKDLLMEEARALQEK